MKKIFAFAIALVAMATSMVSCNNDNADFIEQKAPTGTTVQKEDAQEMKDVSLVVAVTPEQKNYYDDIYTIQSSGKIQTVMVSEMQPATTEEIQVLKGAMELAHAFEDKDAPVELEYYSIKLDQVKSTFSSKILSRELKVKANHPTEQYDFMNAACLCFNGKLAYEAKLDIRFFQGNYGDDTNVKGFADVLNCYTK